MLAGCSSDETGRRVRLERRQTTESLGDDGRRKRRKRGLTTPTAPTNPTSPVSIGQAEDRRRRSRSGRQQRRRQSRYWSRRRRPPTDVLMAEIEVARRRHHWCDLRPGGVRGRGQQRHLGAREGRSQGAVVHVDVQWALAFINDKIDEDELVDRVLVTVDEMR